MDVRQLEIFLEVAHRLNFTAAARALHIAQPAVSQSIAKLEGDLGIALFDRHGRTVRLSEAGNRLAPYAEHILAEVAAAHQAIAEIRVQAAGRVSVGVTPTVATHLLPRILAKFRACCPRVEVTLREGGARGVVSMIERGAVELGIVVLPVEVAGITTDPLFTEELLLATARDSPIAVGARGGAVDLRVAAHEPFILYGASYHLRFATIAGCRAAGFDPRVGLAGGEMETVLRMVAEGLGVSLVPELAFEGVPRPEVVALPVSSPHLTRTLALAWREDRVLAAPATTFMRITHEVVRALHGDDSAIHHQA